MMNYENNEKEIVLLVERAMRNDDSVWEEIYEKTHRYVYFMTLKFLRSEQDAQDITQEVYIKMMRSISQLSSAESFYGWLRSIIYSKCKDLVKKKKPVLLDEDEDGGSLFEDIPDLNEEFLPAKVLDSDETRRMVLELVDALPYLQRQTVMFFYYEEMKVEQIAKLMECALGTVKSRLNYARQQIKQGVEEYERKGIKLYGMGALPILTILLREEAENLFIPQAIAGGIVSILGQIAGTGAGAATQTAGSGAGVAAAGAGTAATTKIIAGVVAIAVVTAGAIAIPRVIEAQSPPSAPPAATDTRKAVEEEQIEVSYYDTLSDEQKQLLARLETSLRNIDFDTARYIQSSYEFQKLCDDIPVDEYSWQGFVYCPDEETRISVYRGRHENYHTYEMQLFLGKDGFGSFRLGKKYIGNHIMDYTIDETSYSNGKANGAFTCYRNITDEYQILYTARGNLHNGAAYGPVLNEGGDYEYADEEYDPEWYNWWPNWT